MGSPATGRVSPNLPGEETDGTGPPPPQLHGRACHRKWGAGAVPPHTAVLAPVS